MVLIHDQWKCDALGYYPNLSQAQLQAVETLKQKLLTDAKIDVVNNTDNEYEHWFFKLLRFLRARRFHIENSYDLFVYDYQWRQTDEMKHLRFLSAQEVLNCDILQMYSYFPTWLQGYDKQGRPVSYRQFGYFEIWNVLKLIDMNTLIKFHTWECEQAIRKMNENSKTLNLNIETFLIVIDAANWSLRLATSDAYTFINNMIQADSKHNAERLGTFTQFYLLVFQRWNFFECIVCMLFVLICLYCIVLYIGTMIIINAPSALSIAYSIIRPFMDDVTRKKTIILSTREQWQPALEELIDKEQIPQMYGGLAPDLTPEQAFDSLNPLPCGESVAVATASANISSSATTNKSVVEMDSVTVMLPSHTSVEQSERTHTDDAAAAVDTAMS